jgi:hypothetical protein
MTNKKFWFTLGTLLNSKFKFNFNFKFKIQINLQLKPINSTLLIASIHFYGQPLFAAVSEYGAVTVGTAGSGRASLEVSDTPFLNPAGLSFIRGYHFSTSYSNQDPRGGRGSQFILSLTDATSESPVPTSLGYYQAQFLDGDERVEQHRLMRLAFSGRLQNNFSMGMGLSYREFFFGSIGPQRRTMIDLASLYSLDEDSGLSFHINNIRVGTPDVDPRIDDEKKLGIAFNHNYTPSMRFKVDVFTDQTSLGVESFVNQWLVWRLGAQRVYQMNGNIFGMGLGFVGPKFGINYGFENNPTIVGSARHVFDLSFPVW